MTRENFLVDPLEEEEASVETDGEVDLQGPTSKNILLLSLIVIVIVIVLLAAATLCSYMRSRRRRSAARQ